jgi:hypothetical protein
MGHGSAQALSGWASRAALAIGSQERRGVRVDCTRKSHSLNFKLATAGTQAQTSWRFKGLGATRRFWRQAPSMGAALGPPFIGPRASRRRWTSASVPLRRGRFGSRNFGGPWVRHRSSRSRRGPPLENSSSSSPIRANTRLIVSPSGKRRRPILATGKDSPVNGLRLGARYPSAPTRRGETERIGSVTGSRSL